MGVFVPSSTDEELNPGTKGTLDTKVKPFVKFISNPLSLAIAGALISIIALGITAATGGLIIWPLLVLAVTVVGAALSLGFLEYTKNKEANVYKAFATPFKVKEKKQGLENLVSKLNDLGVTDASKLQFTDEELTFSYSGGGKVPLKLMVQLQFQSSTLPATTYMIDKGIRKQFEKIETDIAVKNNDKTGYYRSVGRNLKKFAIYNGFTAASQTALLIGASVTTAVAPASSLVAFGLTSVIGWVSAVSKALDHIDNKAAMVLGYEKEINESKEGRGAFKDYITTSEDGTKAIDAAKIEIDHAKKSLSSKLQKRFAKYAIEKKLDGTETINKEKAADFIKNIEEHKRKVLQKHARTKIKTFLHRIGKFTSTELFKGKHHMNLFKDVGHQYTIQRVESHRNDFGTKNPDKPINI